MKPPTAHFAHGILTEDVTRGMYILARSHDGRASHRGIVLDTVPDLGVLWIKDESTGLRKLVDDGEYVIKILK